MTLQETIYEMPSSRRVALVLHLAGLALPIWSEYAKRGKLAYRDSVVGLRHTVDKNMLAHTLRTIEQGLPTPDAEALATWDKEFLEPVVALQDDDWALPDAPLKVFYAVYNLLQSFAHLEEGLPAPMSLYVAANQAIDALLSAGHLDIEQARQLVAAYQ